ncbi:glycosyltransferase [Argonema antarcticum]|uniref:glycosyltransferase n=1 Tax=Argonema antarcticum TaxID=2942763 RepID=UPI002010DAC6|nr:glycosyltransferase [Argonema antarcticum]MCL1475708.1 glycosyltransferase [Argonema antarcticum A004/B2]
MPLISVIIPVYNSAKTIRETIQSVLNQTISDFELIIINDGSLDASIEVISSIQDDRIKVFSYPNVGISPSRNRGLALAQGEFIAFLDHDDLWTPDKLELQLKALQENPDAAVAYSWVDLIDESGEFIRHHTRYSVSGDAFPKLLLDNIIHTASNPLIRKSALIEVGGFDESVFGPEDWDLFLRLAARYHFVAVPRTQVLFRMTATSASTNIVRMETQILKVIERAFSQAPESLQHLRSRTITKVYMYLTFKALEVTSGRQNGLVAARCLSIAVKNDPALLRKPKNILVALFKIAAVLILPSQQAKELLKKVKKLKR